MAKEKVKKEEVVNNEVKKDYDCKKNYEELSKRFDKISKMLGEQMKLNDFLLSRNLWQRIFNVKNIK